MVEVVLQTAEGVTDSQRGVTDCPEVGARLAGRAHEDRAIGRDASVLGSAAPRSRNVAHSARKESNAS